MGMRKGKILKEGQLPLVGCQEEVEGYQEGFQEALKRQPAADGLKVALQEEALLAQRLLVRSDS